MNLKNQERIIRNDEMMESPNLRFGIEPENSINVRSKVLSLTPKDRKRLGINKSTLWYMQKHIKEGKKIKVYKKINEKIRYNMDKTEEEVLYNVQLFLTEVGVNKYHLKTTVAAMRPDLGGRPCILIKSRLVIPKDNNRYTILTTPFRVQNINGYLRLVETVPFLEWQTEFIAEGNVLGVGWVSPTRFFIDAPKTTLEMTLKRQKEIEKTRKREEKADAERERKEFIEAKKEYDKLSPKEISVLQEIKDNNGIVRKIDKETIQKLLYEDYIGTEKGLLRTKYFYKSKGAMVMNYIKYKK